MLRSREVRKDSVSFLVLMFKAVKRGKKSVACASFLPWLS